MNLERIVKLKKIVKNSYNINASHFNATRSKMAAADFLWAAGKINKSDKVLDAGCGNGRLLDYIEVATDNYLGLDNNLYLVQTAKSRYPKYNFIQQDLDSLNNLNVDNFSRIFCSAVIIHIPSRAERHRLLTAFYNVSSHDAKLLISFWKMTGPYYNSLKIKSFFVNLFKLRLKNWRDLVFPWLDQDGKKAGLRYYHYFSKRELKKELQLAGWKIEEELNDRYNYWFVAAK